MNLDVGFTGTCAGLNATQILSLRDTLLLLHGSVQPKLFSWTARHGDCKGADFQFHNLARRYSAHIISHPPSISTHRANAIADETLPPLPYLTRNHAIVDACSVLIAGVGTVKEVTRSGTWATIRYARESKCPRVVLYPDGTIHWEKMPK